MVSRVWWILASIWVGADVNAGEFDEEELRYRAQRAEEVYKQQVERQRASSVEGMIKGAGGAAPAKGASTTGVDTAPSTRSTKYSVTTNAPGATTARNSQGSSNKVNTSSGIPARQDVEDAKALVGRWGGVKTDMAKRSAIRFGIRLGTRLYAELRYDVSSADGGLTEFVLTRDTIGDYRTLSAGTRLYAQGVVNAVTKRVEYVCVSGITPDGDEIAPLTALALDETEHMGLAGAVQINTTAVAGKGIGKGVVAAAKAGAAMLASGANPILGAAVNEAAGSVANDAGIVVEEKANTNIIIYLPPQPAIFRVEKTF